MKTKTLANGSTKVWYDNEAEFKIINKSKPLIDTLIEAYVIEKNTKTHLIKPLLSSTSYK
jgi:hypothetical protein